tara:strand:+ start:2101 stop:3024 length:924 start_codon:yes stop_codon:yes gene_type:complete
MKIIAVGHVSIDHVNSDNTWVEQIGGAATYTAMAAKIFSDVGIVSRVGIDFPSTFYHALEKAGINISGLKKVKGKSANFKIQYDENGVSKYDIYNLNVGTHIRPEDIPINYLHSDAFHLAPMAATKQGHFIEFLREKTKAQISMNTHIGYFTKYRKNIMELIPKVDIFTMNEEEAMALTQQKTLSHSLNVLKKKEHTLVIITTGPGLSIILERGDITVSHTQNQAQVVDLTGCGDAYAGAFISSMLHTKDSTKSANIASSVASIVASDWNIQAIKNLKFKSIITFQEYIIARQRESKELQQSIEHYL